MARKTARTAIDTARQAIRAAKYLYAVRAALPAYLRWLIVAAIAVKVATAPLPFDGGIDELLIVVCAALLWFRHRTLVRACWHEAGRDHAKRCTKCFQRWREAHSLLCRECMIYNVRVTMNDLLETTNR